MQPTDNDMQPGTGKNARRMCLNHQTIQNFYIIGTKIKKGKKKKGEGGGIVFEAPRFLGQGFCRGKLQSHVAMGLGRSWHQDSCSPGCSALELGFSYVLSTFPLPGPSHVENTEGVLLDLAPGGCPNKGLLETPAHPIHCGERSHAQECCIFPEKPVL